MPKEPQPKRSLVIVIKLGCVGSVRQMLEGSVENEFTYWKLLLALVE